MWSGRQLWACDAEASSGDVEWEVAVVIWSEGSGKPVKRQREAAVFMWRVAVVIISI